MFFKNSLNQILKNLDRELERVEEGEVTHVYLSPVDGLEEELRNRGFEVDLSGDVKKITLSIGHSLKDFLYDEVRYQGMDVLAILPRDVFYDLKSRLYNSPDEHYEYKSVKRWITTPGKLKEINFQLYPEWFAGMKLNEERRVWYRFEVDGHYGFR